jgi:hypothetical protein
MFHWLIGDPNSTAWLMIDRISILLSYLVVVTIVTIAWQCFRFIRLRRRLGRLAGTSRRPRALALAFGGGTIKVAVQEFLATAYRAPVPVEEYVADEVTPRNVHRHLEQIRRIKERLQTEGVTELHLFLKAPVVVGTAVGAIFDNWVGVKLYHKDREGGYVAWTTLGQAKAASIPEELADGATELFDLCR